MPEPSSNFIQQHCFNGTLKNIIKTTDMDGVKGTLTKDEGITTSSETEPINSRGHFAWAQPESAGYIVPYFLTTWVTPPK